ncbi:hypothetical protein PMI07_006332 [Rhizobium sp. CF080]|uniref:TRAFAC clade GTPase domain-containing protein n=1 Tax=Rhizobium sp. (strain CF080) TaxID=1144310 RepID=UPI0002718117|nr:hypothetical protein [Rhizobium sp. CF080]EUC00052.1 hypothetical protein PMI07_006332 [Rhizobium sp. CF080]
MSSNILLLGEYNVGKTNFGGQLLGRLNQEKGYLRMVGTPSSLSPFENALSSLNDGRAAQHTSASQYSDSRWPVADADGNSTELIWPDYGGEQVSSIRDNRSMPPEWRKRVETADAWIVMMRINNSSVSDDIFSRPLSQLTARQDKQSGPFRMSDQSRLVDFLQWLMFVRGTGTLSRVSTPRLLLLLSCWDELTAPELNLPPLDVLRRRMPMVSSFVEANWDPNYRSIIGLSALEKSLSEDTEDEDYIDLGPEHFGYIVQEDGSRSPDLTLAIKPVLGRT